MTKPASTRSNFFRIRNAIAKRAQQSVLISGHRIRASADNDTLIEIVREADAQDAYSTAVLERLDDERRLAA